MGEVIEGEVIKAPRKRRRKQIDGELGIGSGSAGPGVAGVGGGLTDWIYETFNYKDYARDTEILTGAPPAQQPGIVASLQQRYATAVADLDSASAALDNAESNLLSIQDDVFSNGTEQDRAAWSVQYDKVIAAQSTRDSARSSLQTVAGWIQQAKAQLGMAALPAIPWSLVAGVAAAAAALYAVANAANNFFNQWQVASWNAENMRRQQAGEAPLQGGPQLVDTSGGISAGLGSTADIIKYATWGLIAFLVIPPVLRMIEGKTA